MSAIAQCPGIERWLRKRPGPGRTVPVARHHCSQHVAESPNKNVDVFAKCRCPPGTKAAVLDQKSEFSTRTRTTFAALGSCSKVSPSRSPVAGSDGQPSGPTFISIPRSRFKRTIRRDRAGFCSLRLPVLSMPKEASLLCYLPNPPGASRSELTLSWPVGYVVDVQLLAHYTDRSFCLLCYAGAMLYIT